MAAGNRGVALDQLVGGQTYWIQIRSPERVPTIYDLRFELDASAPNASVDLATSQADAQSRRDVILGGTGNDILSGGPGEDWIQSLFKFVLLLPAPQTAFRMD